MLKDHRPYVFFISWLIVSFMAAAHAQSKVTKETNVKIYTFSKPDLKVIEEVSQSYWDQVNKKLEKSHILIRLIETPLKRALLEVDNGRLDGDTGRTKITVEKSGLKRIFQIKEHMATIKLKAFVPLTSQYHKISDIPETATIGNLQGDALSSYVVKTKNSLQGQSYDQLIAMLKKKRIDLFLGATLDDIPLFEIGEFKVKALEDSYIEKNIYPILNNKYKGSELEKELNKAIKELMTSGVFNRIKTDFLQKLSQQNYLKSLYAIQ